MSHSLAVTESGALYSWGNGNYGKLGHGDVQSQLLPKRVEAMQEHVCIVAAGEYHSLAITASGMLYSWGDDDHGKLGHGDRENQLLPKRVEALQERVCSAAAGCEHSLAVTQSGALYAWGYGGEGQLGHGDEEEQRLPKWVEGMQERVCSVAAGQLHSLALIETGALYSWGRGSCGKLGHGDEEDQRLPKRVEGLQGVCCITAGSEHTVAVAKDGTAHGWGIGEDETLGLQLTEHQMTPLEYKQLRLAVP